MMDKKQLMKKMNEKEKKEEKEKTEKEKFLQNNHKYSLANCSKIHTYKAMNKDKKKSENIDKSA